VERCFGFFFIPSFYEKVFPKIFVKVSFIFAGKVFYKIFLQKFFRIILPQKFH